MPLHNNEIILEMKYPIAPSFDWLLDDPLTVHDGAKFRKKVCFSLRSLVTSRLATDSTLLLYLVWKLLYDALTQQWNYFTL